MSEIKINISATDAAAIAAIERVEAAQEKLNSSGSKLASQYSGLGAASGSRSAALDRETASYRSLDDELQNLLGRLDPVYKAQQQMDSASDLLHQGLQKGLLTHDQYASSLGKIESTYMAASKGAGHLAHGSNAAGKEMMVIAHEAVAGNFSKIPGSFMVLARSLDGLLGPLALVGAAVTGGIMAWEKYNEATKKAATDATLSVTEETDKLVEDLNKQILLIDQRNAMLKQGVRGNDAEVANASALMNRMQKEQEALANLTKSYGDYAKTLQMYNDTLNNLARDTTEYNKLVNAMAAKETGDELTKKLKGAAAAESAAAKQRYQEQIAEQENMVKLYTDYGRREQAFLDNQHANKLITEEEFYTQKHELALRSMNIELSILQTEDAIAKARHDKKKSDSVQSRMEELQQRLQFETAAGNQYDNILRRSAKSALDIETEKYRLEKRRLEDAHAMKYLSEADFQQRMEALKRNHEATVTQLGISGQLTRQEFEASSMTAHIGIISGILQNATAQAAQHNRVMFEINKQASAVNAFIATEEAAAKALTLGPIAGPIMAGIIEAAGLINVAAIERAQYGGGSNGRAPSAGGVGSTAIPGQTANPNVVGTAPQSTAPSLTGQNAAASVQIYLTGNVLTPDFVNQYVLPVVPDYLRAQIANSDVTIIDPRSRQAAMLQTA